MPASPQSSRVRASPLPLRLPGWKSPWTSVSGRPQASIAANLRGRSPRNCPSASRSSTDESGLVRLDTSRISELRARARQSGRPRTISSSARPIHDTLNPDEKRHHLDKLVLVGFVQVLPHGPPPAKRGNRHAQGPGVPAPSSGPRAISLHGPRKRGTTFSQTV